MFQFKHTLTQEDYLTFQRYHYFNAPVMKGQIRAQRVLLPVMLLMVAVTQFMRIVRGGPDPEPVTLAALFVTFSVVWAVFYRRIMTLFLMRSIKAQAKRGTAPFNYAVELRFEENVFIESTPDCAFKSVYDRIERMVPTEDAVYLYTSPITALILPGRTFICEEQRIDFLNFLRWKIDIAQGRIPPGGM